jgi:hypothetical protein
VQARPNPDAQDVREGLHTVDDGGLAQRIMVYNTGMWTQYCRHSFPECHRDFAEKLLSGTVPLGSIMAYHRWELHSSIACTKCTAAEPARCALRLVTCLRCVGWRWAAAQARLAAEHAPPGGGAILPHLADGKFSFWRPAKRNQNNWQVQSADSSFPFHLTRYSGSWNGDSGRTSAVNVSAMVGG